MDKEKRTRQMQRTSFTRVYNKLLVELNRELPDIHELTNNIGMLESKLHYLLELDSTIIGLMLDDDNVTDDDLNEESEKADDYRNKFGVIKSKVTEVLKSVRNIAPDNINLVTSGNTSRKYRLPEIELKKFGGELKEWLHFWSQFRKIDEDEQLADEDKFQYLLQATIEGSRARELVVSFPPTGKNYKKAIEGLKARFGRDDMLVEVYIRELLTLVLKRVMDKGSGMSLSTLYDKLESQLRALESLGVTSDKYAAMLFPLVESCMPENLLRAWQRMISLSEEAFHSTERTKDRLSKLMSFLRSEVENEERINLATSSFGFTKDLKDRKEKFRKEVLGLPTANALIVKDNKMGNNCIFCDKMHNSSDCFKARKMSLEDRRKTVNNKKCCFVCLKNNHFAKRCKSNIKCIICDARHLVLMCPELSKHNPLNNDHEAKNNMDTNEEKVLANSSNYSNVFLQTLVVKLEHSNGIKLVRALIDTGSERSYILKKVTEELSLSFVGKQQLVNILFGGVKTSKTQHNEYEICLRNFYNKFYTKVNVLDQENIVDDVSHIKNGSWMKELNNLNIKLTDTGIIDGPIQILLGADIAGKLLTGNVKHLRSGLVAVETYLGWTLMGKLNNSSKLSSISMLIKSDNICKLWELDTIGIKDPIENRCKKDREDIVRRTFLETIKIDETGRYEVQFPWIEAHPPLLNNFLIASKRLERVIQKLHKDNLYHEYEKVFLEWLKEDIIEKVPDIECKRIDSVHFLPHRPVIKMSSATTKIRPVFDASAHGIGQPSLNDCVEKGENLIELIPTILIRFRMFKYGVISDIRKAFLQISLNKKERDYLRFLWKRKDGSIQQYRHRRVVFGVSCSPFLLSATIQYHLHRMLSEENSLYNREIITTLISSFYVDNCIVSVEKEKDMTAFQIEATKILNEGKFELREWEFTQLTNCTENVSANVLGMKWNKHFDTLSIREDSFKNNNFEQLTKRDILSITQSIFDPIGFTCPTTLEPKLLLQKLWKTKLNWDEEVDRDTKEQFLKWFKEIHNIFKINVPRWTGGSKASNEEWSLHTFADASQNAYSGVIFLRIYTEFWTKVQLLQAKSRVCPLKKISIPRLELLAATIASRLYSMIRPTLGERHIKSYFWSDSSTVIAWIKRKDDWTKFVWNRVQEIKSLTGSDWQHVPGDYNPADLPSRGCKGNKLLESKWWEGPSWLYDQPERWPFQTSILDEEEINGEKRKSVVSMVNKITTSWYYNYFSKYTKLVRMLGWIYRFIVNSKTPFRKIQGELSAVEYEKAERKLIWLIQKDSFVDEFDKSIASLQPFKDEEGIIRLKTKVSYREDLDDFRFPMVLPNKHPVVEILIHYKHIEACHMGVQGLLGIIRERFWILGGRKPIRKVIKKCVRCLRQNSQNLTMITPPLPIDRVREANTFEIVGIDLAGPLYLKDKTKAWVMIFTCAVYRPIHLELINSSSTSGILEGLRRFIARRGRPNIIYSDNSSAFVGLSNSLKNINWEDIVKYCSIQRIDWKFIPPTGAWWGGWWERLIGILKQLLRRVLGRASLSYEEMLTVLCDCEAVINSRPLTYISEDSPELVVLTPAMFLRDQQEVGVPDCDMIATTNFARRIRYCQRLRKQLRLRFRSEYLGQLKLLSNKQTNVSELKVGEVVMIGNDKIKRLEWPLGVVLELLPGKDNKVRVVKLKTESGILLRPVQRLYRLECDKDI